MNPRPLDVKRIHALKYTIQDELDFFSAVWLQGDKLANLIKKKP